jgi:hypothetical protein
VSTLGIVVLSLFGGLILAIMIGAIAVLIWTNLKLQQTVLQTKLDLESRQTNLIKFLEEHKSELVSMIKKINGDSLELASKSIHLSAGRIEKACVAFGELAKYMLADRDTLSSNGAGLKPEEYAEPEPGERFVSYNASAAAELSSPPEEGE